MRISEICTRHVVTCRRDASASELARLMRERHVGAVVVVDDDHGALVPVGLITDRDLVVEVMALGVAPETLRAADLIVAAPITALDSELVYDAIWHLRSQHIRRLPVVDARGHLVGILTSDDLARVVSEQLAALTGLVPGQIEHERTHRKPSPC